MKKTNHAQIEAENELVDFLVDVVIRNPDVMTQINRSIEILESNIDLDLLLRREKDIH